MRKWAASAVRDDLPPLDWSILKRDRGGPGMARRRYRAEEIVRNFRQAEIIVWARHIVGGCDPPARVLGTSGHAGCSGSAARPGAVALTAVTHEDRPVADMIELAPRYGSYGYRRIAPLLRDTGCQVAWRSPPSPRSSPSDRAWARRPSSIPSCGSWPRRTWISFCARRPGAPPGGCGREAPALVAGLDDLSMMGETVEQGCGHLVVRPHRRTALRRRAISAICSSTCRGSGG